MNWWLPLAPFAGGLAILEISLDDWVRLGLELLLGVVAVVLGSLSGRPQ